jgi:hypothetical protein
MLLHFSIVLQQMAVVDSFRQTHSNFALAAESILRNLITK